jgi:hypothetical protein
MRRLDKRSRNEIVPGMNSSGAKLVGCFDKVSQFRRQERDRDIGCQSLQLVPLETRHNDVMLEPPFKYELLHVGGYRRIFQFDIQQTSCAELIENIGEKRNAFTLTCVKPAQLVVGKACNASFAIRCAIDALVVNNNETSITAPAHIKFEPRGSALKGLIE